MATDKSCFKPLIVVKDSAMILLATHTHAHTLLLHGLTDCAVSYWRFIKLAVYVGCAQCKSDLEPQVDRNVVSRNVVIDSGAVGIEFIGLHQ